MRKIARAMKALSDETRLRIINLLLEQECCVCEVTMALGLSQTRASRNLNILCDVGLIQMRKDGLWSLYSIDRDNMPAYLFDLVQTVRKELRSELTISRDRESLKEAVRTSLRNRCCVSGQREAA
jgi:ArsR family transcriptional regulator